MSLKPGNPEGVSAPDAARQAAGVLPPADEVKLIQDKLDKIGDFRFRVKTWSISVLTGVLASGVLLKFPWMAYVVPLILIGLFWLLEEQQIAWHRAFVSRLNEIESDQRRKSIARLPGLAIAAAKRRSNKPSSIMHAIRLEVESLKATKLGLLILHSSNWFYAGQIVFVIVVAIIAGQKRDQPQEIKLLSPIPSSASSSGSSK